MIRRMSEGRRLYKCSSCGAVVDDRDGHTTKHHPGETPDYEPKGITAM